MDDSIFTATDSSLVLLLRNGKEIRFEPPCDNCDEDDCCARYEIIDRGGKYEVIAYCTTIDGSSLVNSFSGGVFKKSIVSGYYAE